MAFVTCLPALRPAAATSVAVSSFMTPRRLSTPAPLRAASVVRMGVSPQEDKKIPQGFTLFSEQLNGRAAMFGFILALATEVINPNHPGIVAQVTSVVDLIKNI
jgi:hypothetical protein